jgi:hypothetical protein
VTTTTTTTTTTTITSDLLISGASFILWTLASRDSNEMKTRMKDLRLHY